MIEMINPKRPRWYERAIGAFCGALFGTIGIAIALAYLQPTLLTGIFIGVVGMSIGILLGIIFPKIALGFTYILGMFG